MNSLLLLGGAAVIVVWLAGRRAAKFDSSDQAPEMGSFGNGGFGGSAGSYGGAVMPYPAMNIASGPQIVGQKNQPLLDVSQKPVAIQFAEDIGFSKKKSELSEAPLLRRTQADDVTLRVPRSAKVQSGGIGGATQFSGVTTPVSLSSNDAQATKQVVASATQKTVNVAARARAIAIAPVSTARVVSVPIASVARANYTPTPAPVVRVVTSSPPTQFAGVSTPVAAASRETQAVKQVVASASSRPVVASSSSSRPVVASSSRPAVATSSRTAVATSSRPAVATSSRPAVATSKTSSVGLISRMVPEVFKAPAAKPAIATSRPKESPQPLMTSYLRAIGR